jgi:hypothetical protein
LTIESNLDVDIRQRDTDESKQEEGVHCGGRKATCVATLHAFLYRVFDGLG